MSDIPSSLLGILHPAPAAPPIVTQYPAAQQSYINKYADPSMNRYVGGLPPDVRNSLYQYDRQRVARGQHPLSTQETFDVTQSVLNKTPSTPSEDKGFFGSIIPDITNVLRSLPTLPGQLIHQATELPEAPALLSQALATGDASKLSSVPGVSLIPGVYTLSTLASQGPAGLLQHPVYTGLDVLPLAEKLVGSLVESQLSKLPSVEAARATEAVDLPVRNAAREAFGLAPEDPASAARLAVRESPSLQAFRSSPLGTKLSSGFGQTAGDMAQGAATSETVMNQALDPNFPIENVPEQYQPIRTAVLHARDWAANIPDARRVEITDALKVDRNQVFNDPNLTDAERGMANDYITDMDTLGRVAQANDLGLQTVDDPTSALHGEILNDEQAARLNKVRQPLEQQRLLTDTREAVANPTITAGATPPINSSTILDETLRRKQALDVARGQAHTLDVHGFDNTPILDTIKLAAKDRTVPLDNVKLAVDDALANPIARPVMTAPQIIDTLKSYTTASDGAARVRNAANVAGFLQTGDWRSAYRSFRDTMAGHVNPIPEADPILDSLKRGADRAEYLNKTSNYSPRNLAKLEKRAATLETKIVPARFMDQLESGAVTELRSRHLDDPEALQLIDEGLTGTVRPELGTEYASILKDAMRGWQDLRASGVDPVFVHRVNRLSAAVSNPSLSDVLKTPSFAKARTGDMTPHIGDISVGLSHYGVDMLSKLGTREFINNFLDLHGISQAEATGQYIAAARRIAAHTGENVDAVVQRLFERDYVKYDPATIFPHAQAKIYAVAKEGAQYIPKNVDTILKDMFKADGYRLTAVFDPAMKIFRTAVLPLSPRWHINNIGGGLMLGFVESGPKFIANLKRGYDFWHSGEYDKIRGMPPGGNVSQPLESALQYVKQSSYRDRIAMAHDFQGGMFLRKIVNALGPVKDALGNVVERSYRFNQMVDDIYRSTAYITGHDKAVLRDGLTAGSREAQQAGIALVRKILPQWDRMTPLERTVMRSVFPFYSWAKFITGYALRYPVDHPFRVAVTASLARAEMQDRGDALPTRFMDMLFLGEVDPTTGMRTGISTGSINPFSNVADYFTIAGFTGNLNPVAQAVLQTAGVDTSKGVQDLYPDITVDPATGRLKPVNPSFLSSLASNVLPQSQLVSALIGRNNEFKNLLRGNPQAAASFLISSAGFPNIYRHINPSIETFNTELANESSQKTVKSEALKTGDYSRAMQFPALRAYFNQLTALRSSNPNLFAQYTPTSTQPGVGSALRASVPGSS